MIFHPLSSLNMPSGVHTMWECGNMLPAQAHWSNWPTHYLRNKVCGASFNCMYAKFNAAFPDTKTFYAPVEHATLIDSSISIFHERITSVYLLAGVTTTSTQHAQSPNF